MIGTIVIDQIRVDCIIGVYDVERNIKQPILIDVEMNYDSSKACQSDHLKHAIDYFQVTEDIHSYVSGSSFQLIEALVAAIADRILLNNKINSTKVKVSKPNALTKANTVSFSLVKSNN